MSSIISAIKWIVDLLTQIVNMIESFFENLIHMVTNLPKVVEFLTGAITALPGPLVVFATATIGITVAYLVLGRDTGGNS